MKIDPPWGCVIFFDQLKANFGQGPIWRWIHRRWLTKQLLQIKILEVSANTFPNEVCSIPAPAFPWLPEVQM